MALFKRGGRILIGFGFLGSWILIPFNIMISVINAIWIKKIIIIT
jgi:hypothetical protein